MPRIGVFVCWCGRNIAGTVDPEKVVQAAQKLPGVAKAADYKYMCSQPGQKMIRDAIRDDGLEAVVVAACSPRLHETTFRNTCGEAGLNPYLCEIANIREHCSWVHSDMEQGTLKSQETVAALVEKIRRNEALIPIRVPIHKRAVVIGGGIAGIEAALSIAAGGYPVVLVERDPALGGNVARLSHTFTGRDSSPCILGARVSEVLRHPGIEVLTRSVVEDLAGYVGNFRLKIRTKKTVEAGETDTVADVEAGAIVVATGYSPYPMDRLTAFGAGLSPDVIDGLGFEEMLSAWEREGRPLGRPSDGKIPQEVAFIQCAGSRDREKGVAYCSRICCLTTAKHAAVYKQAVPGGQAYIFYSHFRAGGKGFEEFVQTSSAENRVIYLRGEVSRVFADGDGLHVWGRDEIAGREVDVQPDLVVLSTPLVPGRGAGDLAKVLKVATDENGFFAEVHPKLRPVESATRGIFLAGCAQAPRDIPESIAHALAAVAKVQALFSSDTVSQDPIVVQVDPDYCRGCGICVAACPYEARKIDPWTRKARVLEILCQGCGACVTACPNGATRQRNFTKPQIMKMIDAALGG
jgi:heterodisulfide reductase subunit A